MSRANLPGLLEASAGLHADAPAAHGCSALRPRCGKRGIPPISRPSVPMWSDGAQPFVLRTTPRSSIVNSPRGARCARKTPLPKRSRSNPWLSATGLQRCSAGVAQLQYARQALRMRSSGVVLNQLSIQRKKPCTGGAQSSTPTLVETGAAAVRAARQETEAPK